jgi:hypothetical protein
MIADGIANELTSMLSSAPTTLAFPSGLEALLDAGQLVIHMGNLRHDYSWYSSAKFYYCAIFSFLLYFCLQFACKI